MSVHLRFWIVWGINGAGERIELRIFAQDTSSAKRQFFAQTGVVADGAVED